MLTPQLKRNTPPLPHSHLSFIHIFFSWVPIWTGLLPTQRLTCTLPCLRFTYLFAITRRVPTHCSTHTSKHVFRWAGSPATTAHHSQREEREEEGTTPEKCTKAMCQTSLTAHTHAAYAGFGPRVRGTGPAAAGTQRHGTSHTHAHGSRMAPTAHGLFAGAAPHARTPAALRQEVSKQHIMACNFTLSVPYQSLVAGRTSHFAWKERAFEPPNGCIALPGFHAGSCVL